jgi:hypothetical protein
MQHDAYVSSIFLQENRFNPPPGGYFFARFSPVRRARRPVFLIRFGARVLDSHNPSEKPALGQAELSRSHINVCSLSVSRQFFEAVGFARPVV